MGKTTEKLKSMLINTRDIEHFIQANEDHFAERDLAAYLKKLLKEKNMKKSDVFKRAGFNASYGYDVFSQKRKPSRDKALSLCFGLMLNADEANHLLYYASLSQLYPRFKRDSIIMFALDKHIDIDNCNYLLLDSGEDIIE